MTSSDEFRSVKTDTAEILKAELPEQCLDCPTRGIEAGAIAVAAAVRYDGLPRENAENVAHNLAKIVRAECTVGPSNNGGDFPSLHCNLGVRH